MQASYLDPKRVLGTKHITAAEKFDRATAHSMAESSEVRTALDEVPSGMELTERVWLPRGLHVSYRSVRLVVRRTPPLEIATDGLVRGPVGDWQPVRLHMRREHGSSDLVLREAATEPQSMVRSTSASWE